MGRGWRPLIVVVAATFVLAQFAVFEPSAATDAGAAGGDPDRGQVVFERTCASCHGAGVREEVPDRGWSTAASTRP